MPTFGNGLPLQAKRSAIFPVLSVGNFWSQQKGGDYAAVVEFRDKTAFQAMHSDPKHDEAGKQVAPLFDGSPTPTFYQVISG